MFICLLKGMIKNTDELQVKRHTAGRRCGRAPSTGAPCCRGAGCTTLLVRTCHQASGSLNALLWRLHQADMIHLRRTTFVSAVKQAGRVSHVFAPSNRDVVYFNENVVKGERYTPPANEARAIRSWLRKLPKPVAVFCSHDLRAYQVLTLCREAGIAVPNEVAILGVDDDAILCGFTAPTLSSIDPNGFVVGREAVRIACEMLFSQMARRNPPRSFIKPARLIVRGSSEIYPIDPPWLSDALVYINRNAAKGVTAADVFAYVGLSHTTVGSAFRQNVGMSVQDMLAKVRLEEACQLLETGMSVTDVAYKSGFSSVQYFCRAFAAEHGMSPAVWQVAKLQK